MRIVHDEKLLQLIKVIPPVIVTIFACIAIFIVINHNRTQLTADIESLQKNFIASEKEMIKAQVKQLVQQTSYERDSTEALLKNDIKNYIYQAHNIATSIYKENQHKPEQEVKRLITTALRDIRFNEQRGYFFIYSVDGQSILHPILPQMEGTSKADLQDSRGNYIVRELATLSKRYGESFYHWWFVKPENKSKEFEKIGFGKYFAPYDWFIGTGEYLVDVENDIKQRLIKRISNMSFGENRYIFLLDYQGNMLSHINKDLQGTNLLAHPDSSIVNITQQLIAIAEQGEGYLEYMNFLVPSTGKPGEKISFVSGFPQWNWVIGTGFYKGETDKYLAKREQDIAQENQSQLLTLLALSLFVTVFFISLSLLLSNYLSKRFTLYKEKMNIDFNELNEVKLQSQYQALHDVLTGLPNRMQLDQQISQGITLSKQSNKSLAVMFIDLDDFKKINDLHGHSVGDNLLKFLGGAFKKVLTDRDSVVRFGGDEFIFCFPALSNKAQAQQKVAQIQKIFAQEFIIKGKSIYSSCSVGVAMYPSDGNVAEELISKADIVLYKSKAQQKGRSLFFNESINKQVKRDFLIESELREALSKNEFSVLYQPQISVDSGKIVAVEALIRWYNKILGHVSPDEFIQVAEDIGMIHDIGSFVIEQALQDILHYNVKHNATLELSLNISPKQLIETNFAEQMIAAIEQFSFKANLVTLEITENIFISDLDKVQPILKRLRDHGFRLSLDDFGTGYSSLSYLSNLPMNEIKIDRSFINKLLVSSQSEALVKTIIAIGQFYNLTVVAEGVESKAQFERLKHYNCDLIQGYYFDRPLSIIDLHAKYSTHDVS
ncbi:bifunctional diguanylate cyclase/phosphodiesterase [Colwellia ponticola]|uniref:bifunctional diguanylate cyclase/phosphodiesterase n=1 Tax=Colwellia ponticola TaxID=2304625 RepID=UPI001FE80917|nr:cache domain-containing protein [Colwellia ponticola]